MDSFGRDNVEAEKADAMRIYNRKKKFNYLLLVFAPLLVLLFCSSKWILIAIETGANCLREVTPTIGDKPLLPFMLINVLIFTIFMLSRKKPTQQPDIYDEYVTNTASSPRKITAGDDSPVPKKSCQEINYDKPIICSSPKEQGTETTLCPVQTDTVDTDTVTEEEEEEEEEEGQELVVDLEPERQPSVHDEMSDVEFNAVICTYIYKQKKGWWQERIFGDQGKQNKDDLRG